MPDLVDELERMRPDLAATLPDVIDRFRSHTWRRRRSPDRWADELRRWCAEEGAPAGSARPRRDAGWLRRRVDMLLRFPDHVLEAQLADDALLAALFAGAGGRDGVARLSPEQLVERYTLAQHGQVADPARDPRDARRTTSTAPQLARVAV